MTTYKAVFTGINGNEKPDEIRVAQDSTETDLVFNCYNGDGTPYVFEVGDVVTGSFVNKASSIEYGISGTITPSPAGSTMSWARTVSDVGLDGNYKVFFKVISLIPKTDYTVGADYIILPIANGAGTLPSPLVGVSVAEAAWLTLADQSDVDASDLLTATIAAADFDAAGSAGAVAGDLTAHEGLTGTAVHGLGAASLLPIPASKIRVIGDSIAAGATVAELQAELSGATVSTFAIGGETSDEILARVEGVAVIRPSRTATLTGATDLVVAENVPPRMINGSYSASWEGYSTGDMLQIDSVAILNHDKRIGSTLRRRYLAKCDYGTSITHLELWRAIANQRSMAPEFSFEQYADGTNVSTMPSFSSVARATGEVSSLFSHTGQKSLEFTSSLSSAGGLRFELRNGLQSQLLGVNSFYEISLWVYVPVAFSGGGTIILEPYLPDDLIWLSGTGTIDMSLNVGTWQRMHFLHRRANTVFMSFNLVSGDFGKKFYIDDLELSEVYTKSTDTLVDTDAVYLSNLPNSTGEIPSGVSASRRYYLSAAGVDTSAIALTSGGAAVDLVADGYAELFENWHVSWTPSAPDTTTHYLTAEAMSGDYDSFALIWTGLNDISGLDNTIGNIRAIVEKWTKKHGDRFAVLTLNNYLAIGESFYYDQWEAVRQWIMSEYPNNYVDTYQAGIDWGLAQTEGTQPCIDAINKKVPDALLSDGVHPNATGNAVMFTAPVKAFLIENGYYIAA